MQTSFFSALRSSPDEQSSGSTSTHTPTAVRLIVVLSLLLVGLGTSLPVQAQTQPSVSVSPIQASDFYKIREIQDVTLSPNGRYAAYTVRRAVAPSQDSTDLTYRRQLFVVPANGRDTPHILTRARKTASQPAWHPDGTYLAFVRPVQGTPQIFLLSLSGGEAYQLTDTPYGAMRPQWGPEGTHLLFASSVPRPAIARHTDRYPSTRPGRSPDDTLRSVPPDTLLVLRHARSLTPVDTLALGPDSRPQRLPNDTLRTLRTPTGTSDSLSALSVDQLASLAPDSLRAVFAALRLHPDTTTVSADLDMRATPNGSLLQVRRWLDRQSSGQSSSETVQVFSQKDLQTNGEYTPTPRYRHYFVVEVPENVDRGSPPRPSIQPVTWGFRTFSGGTWLPNGSQIVVSGTPQTWEPLDQVHARNLYVADLDRSRIQRLLQIDDYALSAPKVTADGRILAFRADPLSDSTYAQTRIGLFSVSGRSEPQFITETFDHDISSIRWSPNGWYLYATAPSKGEIPLFRFAPFARGDTSAPSNASPSLAQDYSTSRDTFALDSSMVRTASYKQMTANGRNVQAFDATDASVVYAVQDADNPSELYTNTVNFQNERRLSSHNARWLTRRRLSSPERLSVQTDGVTVTGSLTPPPAPNDSLTYPLIVLPRGGPLSDRAYGDAQSWFETQYLAARGFGVAEVRPRGSAGYGADVHRLAHKNWSTGPASDVLAVADSVASFSWVDADQQVIAGRAYGAYLTAWIVSQTDRFEAAVAQNGFYDLTALLDEGKIGRLVAQQFDGYPWEGRIPPPPNTPPSVSSFLSSPDSTLTPRAALERNSPMTYAHRIQTPLLLSHSTNAPTGKSQTERLYGRLKVLDQPTEYVRYPAVATRELSPIQALDRLVRLFEFAARFTSPGGHPPQVRAEAP